MSGKSLILVGLGLTLVFGAFVAWLGAQNICSGIAEAQTCRSNFQIFLESDPNEKGDTLAGVAGSLAFLWIVITVLLQSRELALQRLELAQTRVTLEAQTNLLSEQALQRTSEETDRLIGAKLRTLKELIAKPSFEYFDMIDTRNDKLLQKHMSFFTNKQRSLGITNEDYAKGVRKTADNLNKLRARGIYAGSPDFDHWQSMKDVTSEILLLAEGSTRAMSEQVIQGEHVRQLDEALDIILDIDLWIIPNVKLAT